MGTDVNVDSSISIYYCEIYMFLTFILILIFHIKFGDYVKKMLTVFSFRNFNFVDPFKDEVQDTTRDFDNETRKNALD